MGQIKDSVIGGIGKVLRRPLSVLRGGIIGWLIGVLPALGTSAAGISAYLIEKKFSRESDQFGKGSMDGLTAAETGKGACILGDGITSLMLGVPGSVTWAILMAALIIHGVQPGPRFMTAGVLPYTVFAGLLLGQVGYFLFGILVRQVHGESCLRPEPNPCAGCGDPLLHGGLRRKELCLRHLDHGRPRHLFLRCAAQRLPDRADHPGFHPGRSHRSKFPSRPCEWVLVLTRSFSADPSALAMVIVTLGFIAWPWIADLIRRRRLSSGRSIEALDAITDKEVNEIGMGELLFGGLVAVLLVVFLWASYRYVFEVRLFPVIVCVAGLALSAVGSSG